MGCGRFSQLDQEMEKFFNYTDTPKEKKVKLVALRLKSGASAWWEQIQENRRRCGKKPIKTWPRMQKLMKERFLPINYEQILYKKYYHCKQGTRTVAEYTEEFDRLSVHNNLVENENQQIARYVIGVYRRISKKGWNSNHCGISRRQ